MTTYFHQFKTIMAAFSLLLLTMIASSAANAAYKELQSSFKFAPLQVADLAHPGAAVIHHRNAKARRHAATQPTTAPSTTPK